MAKEAVSRRSLWYLMAHGQFDRIPDAGRESLDFGFLPKYFENWFASYGKGKFAMLKSLSGPELYLFVRMYVRFMDEYREMLKEKFAWLTFVKFTHILTFTVDPKRFFHLRDEFRAVSHGWNKISAWLRKRYGPFFFIRVLEIQKSGRPHLHVLAVLPEWVDYAAMRELWDKKYDIGVQCRFDGLNAKSHDGLSYVLKYVQKSMSNLESCQDNLYAVLLFASNRRLWSMGDVRRSLNLYNGGMLDRGTIRVIPTFEYVGWVFASLFGPGPVPDMFVLSEDPRIESFYDEGAS